MWIKYNLGLQCSKNVALKEFNEILTFLHFWHTCNKPLERTLFHRRKMWEVWHYSLHFLSSQSHCCLWETIKIRFSFPKKIVEEKQDLQSNIQINEILRREKFCISGTELLWKQPIFHRGSVPRDREGWRVRENRKKGPKESGAGAKLGRGPAPLTHSVRAYALIHAGHTPTHPPPHWSRQIPLMTKELSQHQLLGVLARILSFSRSSASPVSS